MGAPGGNTIYTILIATSRGPKAGLFPAPTPGPNFNPIPASPDRREPFREFTIHYHEVTSAIHAFPECSPLPHLTPDLSYTLAPGNDNFAINYGSASIPTSPSPNPPPTLPNRPSPSSPFDD